MAKSFKAVVQTANEAILESELEFAKDHNQNFVIAQIELNDENTFLLKKTIKYAHDMLHFTHILYEGDGVFWLIIRNTKISGCIKKIFDLIDTLRANYSLEDAVFGVTESEANDSVKSLTTRVNKFYLKAVHSEDSKVFYGTAHYEKSNNDNIDKNLLSVFSEDKNLTIYNFYSGIVISESASIVSNLIGEIEIKIPRQKFLYFIHEEFTYIEHALIPHITKAAIIKHDRTKATLTLKHFQAMQNSPVNRQTKRLDVNKNMPIQIKALSNYMIVGKLKNMSIESILVQAKQSDIDILLKHGTNFQSLFNVREEDDTIYKVVCPAYFVHRKSSTEVAFTISPSKAQKIKMVKFLNMLEKEILFDLRNSLLERTKIK